MTVPAITQVQTALAALVGTAVTSLVIVDRAANEPVSAEERPAVLISPGDQVFETFDQAMTQHTAEFSLDVYEDKGATQSAAAKQAVTIAAIVAAMQANRIAGGSALGGLVNEIEETGVSSPDGNTTDVGAVTLTVRVVYFTPRGDFNTIIHQ